MNFKNPGEKLNNAEERLENAGIMAGYSFFTTLAGIRIAAVIADWPLSFLAAGIAAGLSFFSYLATVKGLKR